MWWIETTLATLVITIIASSSMKLAKVSCPIESENDRIRRTIAAKAMGYRDRLGTVRFYTPESASRGTCRIDGTAGRTAPCMANEGSGLQPASGRSTSIGGDAGVLDDFCPKRDVGLDDIGELLQRRALRLTSGEVELLLHVRRRQRYFQ